MGNSVIISPHESDVALITASEAVGGAGAVNLQSQRPDLTWQSLGTTPFITMDAGVGLGSGTGRWNALVLAYFNAQVYDKIRLRAATTEANLTAAPVYDSGNIYYWQARATPGLFFVPVYKHLHRMLVFNNDIGRRWWRIDFTWTFNSDGFVRGGRLMLGRVVRPAQSVAPGFESRHAETVVELEGIGGSLSTRIRGVRRSLSMGWDPGMLTDEEGRQIKELMARRGSSRDVAACVDVTSTNQHMEMLAVGRMKAPFVVKGLPVAYRGTSVDIEELGVIETLTNIETIADPDA